MADTRQSDLVCLWSGKSTTGIKSIDHQEHVFPESIGGKQKLPVGDVSLEWNNKLSWLDNVLKRDHPAMMQAYQSDPNITGKKTSDKEKKKRRHGEKSSINSRNGFTSRTKTNGNTNLLNAQFGIYNQIFSRALHKCVANVLCYERGAIYVRSHYAALLDFVKNGSTIDQWPFAISYANPFHHLLINPSAIKLAFYSNPIDKKETALVCFIHSSGIWICGSQPNSLFRKNVDLFGNAVLSNQVFDWITKEGQDIENLFGWKWESDRKYIGKLGFLLVKERIKGTPDPDGNFFLLTRCSICAQINPTSIMLPRKDFIKEGEIPFSETIIKSGDSITPSTITIGSRENYKCRTKTETLKEAV